MSGLTWEHALAALVAVLALLGGWKLGAWRPGPKTAPPQLDTDPVRREAQDVLDERAARDQERVQDAAASPTPEQDVTDLTNARRR